MEPNFSNFGCKNYTLYYLMKRGNLLAIFGILIFIYTAYHRNARLMK